jgi:hypothetical protein
MYSLHWRLPFAQFALFKNHPKGPFIILLLSIFTAHQGRAASINGLSDKEVRRSCLEVRFSREKSVRPIPEQRGAFADRPHYSPSSPPLMSAWFGPAESHWTPLRLFRSGEGHNQHTQASWSWWPAGRRCFADRLATCVCIYPFEAARLKIN